MIKTVVIGSSGFIAPHLIKKLESLGHEVIPYHHDQELTFKEVDYIFYIAAYGNHYFQKDSQLILKSNVIDYIKLLRYTLEIPYKGLFYFSSSSVTLPVQTDYSDAKFIGEIISKRFCKKHHKPIVCIRPGSVYGEGEAEWRLFPVILKAFKDQSRLPLVEGYHDWIYIEDFINGLILVMQNCHKLIGKSVPIGTGKETSNHKIYSMLTRIVGKAPEVYETEEAKRNYDIKNWVVDPTIIKSLGWKQRYTVYKALKKLWGLLNEE